MAKKPAPETEAQAESATESATTNSPADQPASDALTFKRGPFTLIAKKVAGDDEASHYDITLTKEDTPVKPGQVTPELEHLDVHFEVGASSFLSKVLAGKLFDWFLSHST